jgi:hypothetical protein
VLFVAWPLLLEVRTQVASLRAATGLARCEPSRACEDPTYQTFAVTRVVQTGAIPRVAIAAHLDHSVNREDEPLMLGGGL